MHDPIEPVTRPDLDQRVHVIGHYTPGKQRVSLGVKGQECCLNQLGDSGNREITSAMSLIECRFNRDYALLGTLFGEVFS